MFGQSIDRVTHLVHEIVLLIVRIKYIRFSKFGYANGFNTICLAALYLKHKFIQSIVIIRI